MGIEIAKTILLTGAGFTKNFGGFLATEMWSKIFNHPHVQRHLRLKKLLMEDYDYESIYYRIFGGAYGEDEKRAIVTAIFETYKALDDIAREWRFRNDAPYPVNIYGVNKLIERFAIARQELGFFFTLNQDLFIERHFSSSNTALIHPGIAKIPKAENINIQLPIDNQDYITLPSKEEMQNNPVNPLSINALHYVKLHGSFGWKNSDGSNRLVIGRNKENQIAEEPLLEWYFHLLKEALYQEGRKLLVIGYGFRDEHINKVIAESVKGYGLNLYIISPSDQSKFIKDLKDLTNGQQILEGLSGYFPHNLLEIFPSDQSESHAWREINERYFVDQ